MLWHHDMETAIRYAMVDMTTGGARILTSAPLRESMSGTITNMLPWGIALNRPFSVRWCRRREAGGGGFEAGLRFL